MNLYDLVAGLVLVVGGAIAFLAAKGRIDLHRGDAEKARQWRQQYGRFLTWAGPIIVLFGLLHLAGVM
jgi:hypothetical protein